MGLFSLLPRRARPALPPLRFHNTLSDKLEVFQPMGREVKMYNCGPTVYDYVHIGNLRSYVFADTIRRTLDQWGYKTKQVINITDFGHLVSDADEGEDKMSKGLRREGLTVSMENMRALAERYTAAFLIDLTEIGVDTSRVTFPRASDYVQEQIALVKSLEQKGYAYRLDDGVYFDTERFEGYGKLGRRDIAGQEAGARVEQTGNKRNPADFVLWKSDKKLGWESPWGMGFPGWHIECTAMIFALLGKQIDIHTGGIDHISIHHNNEIAQAEATTGKRYVQYWMHNEFATIEAKRIGKSMGNAIVLSSLKDRGISPRALRYWYLTSHYRSPVNLTWEALEAAQSALGRLQKYFFEELSQAGSNGEPDKKFLDDFYGAIAEDLNTAMALGRVWELVKEQKVPPAAKRASLLEADKVLGLGLSEKRPYFKIAVERTELPADVQTLLTEREAARASKDFKKSDELRAEIEQAGYEVKDTPDGQKLTKK